MAQLMVSALVPGVNGLGSSPDRGHHIVFLARNLTLAVPLSAQEFKWVLANCWGKNCSGVTCNGLASSPGGVEILYRNWDRLQRL